MLTAEEAKRLLSYDPETGILTWRVSLSNRVKVGDAAACKDSRGYSQVKIKGNLYRIHRIIMLMVNGVFPPSDIDHVNRNRSDNRLCNLRCVTRSENMRNAKKPSNNTSGYVGVRWNKRLSKWEARIKANGKHIYLGCFNGIKDAIAARKAAEIKFGFHPNHGSDRPL